MGSCVHIAGRGRERALGLPHFRAGLYEELNFPHSHSAVLIQGDVALEHHLDAGQLLPAGRSIRRVLGPRAARAIREPCQANPLQLQDRSDVRADLP
jgi:hypothetical protein